MHRKPSPQEVPGIYELLRPQALPLTWFLVVGGFVGLPLLVFVPDYSYRYNLQWSSIYWACGGCSALTFFRPSLRRQYSLYLRARFPSEVIALMLLVLVGSILAHGFWVQAVGLCTMLMVLGVWPLLSFLWFVNRESAHHWNLFLRIVIFVLLAESVFLTCYQLLGLGMSSPLSLKLWPRIFLNVRDGNQWLACGFWVPVALWFSRVMRRGSPFQFNEIDYPKIVLLMTLFWYLDLLTYGRGGFLAMALSVANVCILSLYSSRPKSCGGFVGGQLLSVGLSLVESIALRSSMPFSNGNSHSVDMNGPIQVVGKF